MTQQIYFLKLQSAFWQFQTITVSECSLTELLPRILFEKYIYILALEKATLGNQFLPIVSARFRSLQKASS